MKKIWSVLFVIFLLVLCACDNKVEPIKEGDYYIGLVLNEEKDEKIEFIIKSNDQNTVIDYATNFNEGTNTGYYNGMSIDYAFELFIEIIRSFTSIDESKILFILDDNKINDFNAEQLAKKLLPNAKSSKKKDTINNFEKKIVEYKKLMANFTPIEPNNIHNSPNDIPMQDDYTLVIDSEGIIQIDLNTIDHNIVVEADNKPVRIFGDNYGTHEIKIINAESVNMDFTIDEFVDYEKLKSPFIIIENTSYKNVIFPKGVEDGINTERYITENYSFYDISDDGKFITVNFNYFNDNKAEELKKKDIDFINYIMEKGIYVSETGGSYGLIYSDLDIDLGDIILPESDYSGIGIGGNAKVKLSGTITVTGGTLNFEIKDNATLDISELYLIKDHPSPDMLKISFPNDYKGDKELLKPKTKSGEIKYAETENRIDVTIW